MNKKEKQEIKNLSIDPIQEEQQNHKGEENYEEEETGTFCKYNYDSQNPMKFIKELDENDPTWKILPDNSAKIEYLKSNKENYKLKRADIKVIGSLLPTETQQPQAKKTTLSKQQKSGKKPTTSALTINEIHKWKTKPRIRKIANYIMFRVKNPHTGKEESAIIQITINSQSREVELAHMPDVDLDLDTLMTEDCYNTILTQSKAGGLPLFTVDELKQIFEDLMKIQSQFIYFKKDIYYKIAALYSITT
ncbi:MAG: hypothetical protein ACFE9L_21025, partial [Candidatus Hodarchaeota archaeon]